MSRESKLAKSTIILAVGTFFPKLAIFIALPILTGHLTKESLGVYDLTITLVALVMPLATLQIQSAAFRFLIETKAESERSSIITNILVFVTAMAFVALVVVFFVAKSQPIIIRIEICLYYLFDIYANVNRQIIRGFSDNISYAISAIISGLGQIVLLYLTILVMNAGLRGCFASLAIAEFLSMLFLFLKGDIYKYIDLKRIDIQETKSLLNYSWLMVPNSLSQWVIHTSDRLVITEFMGIAANGVYSVAYKIPSILSLAQTTFNFSWQESATLSAQDSDAKKYYESMFPTLFNLIAGMMGFLIGATPILFSIFVRGDYREAYNQIPILFMGMFFLCLSTFWGGIFVALKDTKAVSSTTMIAAGINLSSDLLTVKYIGLYAGSISSLVAYSVMCLLRARKLDRVIKLNYPIKHIVIILVILLIQCVICFQQVMLLNVFNFIIGLALFVTINRKTVKNILTLLKRKARKDDLVS